VSEDLVSAHVRKILEARLLDSDATAARIAEVEARGGRIVDGGQGPYDENGTAPWEVTDWRTGELLASGRSADPDDADGEAAALDPGDTWHHIDGVSMETEPTEVVAEGIPASLGAILDEWVSYASTTDEEIAGFVGWPVEKVRRCRGGP
jgi:hypothetical protein